MSTPGKRGGPVVRGVAVAILVVIVVAVVVFIVGLQTKKGETSVVRQASSPQTTPSTTQTSSSGEVTAARALTRQQPENGGAWERLARALLQQAGGSPYVTSTGTPTTAGKALMAQTSEAWSHYLALSPPKPNTELAQLMADVYGEDGLNEPAKAVEALQIVVAQKPNDAALYADLAEYAYKAHNSHVGDLAAEKAAALSPAADRKRIEEGLAEEKANPSGEKTYTTTTNGKTYTGKLNSKGELKATEVKTMPVPSTTSKIR